MRATIRLIAGLILLAASAVVLGFQLRSIKPLAGSLSVVVPTSFPFRYIYYPRPLEMPVTSQVTVKAEYKMHLQYPSVVKTDETFIVSLTPELLPMSTPEEAKDTSHRDGRISPDEAVAVARKRVEDIDLLSALYLSGATSAPQEPIAVKAGGLAKWSVRTPEPGTYRGFIRVTVPSTSSSFRDDFRMDLDIPQFNDILISSNPRLFDRVTISQAIVAFLGSYLTLAGLVDVSKRLRSRLQKKPSPIISP